jgi:hypothetical protein
LETANGKDLVSGEGRMLKVQRSANGQVVFTLSGQMDAESIAELETFVQSEADGRPRVLDLKDVTLVDQDAVNFLDRCEMENITLKNCPAYIREWITRQRREVEG